jgi:hypothetical protein
VVYKVYRDTQNEGVRDTVPAAVARELNRTAAAAAAL